MTLRLCKRLHWLIGAAVLLQYGSCVTTSQLKEFIRTEVALLTTQLVAEPFNDALADLAGPQVVEEIVPPLIIENE